MRGRRSASSGGALDRHKVLVTKSTVPIGTGRWLETAVEDAMQAEARNCGSFSIVSNPEFLRQGAAVDDFMHPDRVVLGGDDPDAVELVADLYRPILEQTFEGGRRDHLPELVRTGIASAEMLKYASNAFLALKVSFVNEIANICELDRRRRDAGRARGSGSTSGSGHGSSRPASGGADRASARTSASSSRSRPTTVTTRRSSRATRDVNCWQRELVVKKLRRRLHGLRGRRIGLLGLAFKPGTDDLRDAPAVEIAEALLRGGAQRSSRTIRSSATFPASTSLSIVDDPYDVASRADAVVLLTEWPEYLELELDVFRDRMRGDAVRRRAQRVRSCEGRSGRISVRGHRPVGHDGRSGDRNPAGGCRGWGLMCRARRFSSRRLYTNAVEERGQHDVVAEVTRRDASARPRRVAQGRRAPCRTRRPPLRGR